MTWVVIKPYSFGTFFPDGDYVGHDEQHRRHYENEMLNGRAEFSKKEIMSLLLNSSEKFKKDLGWLAECEQPKVFRTVKTYDSLASLIMLNNELMVIDESLKSVIEDLEPSMHQFWPIDIVMPKGRKYPKKYYGMVIHTYLNSFRLDNCDPGVAEDSSIHGYIDFTIKARTKRDYKGLAMSRMVIGGHHLWREKYLRHYWMFLSDELAARIKEAELRIATHYKMKDV